MPESDDKKGNIQKLSIINLIKNTVYSTGIFLYLCKKISEVTDGKNFGYRLRIETYRFSCY